MKFSIKDFFSKCDQIPQFFADLVTFTEEIFNEKFQFLCSVALQILHLQSWRIKQLKTSLILIRNYLATNAHFAVCLDHLIILCFDKSEMIKKTKIKKIKAACFSPVFVVHRSNHILSLRCNQIKLHNIQRLGFNALSSTLFFWPVSFKKRKIKRLANLVCKWLIPLNILFEGYIFQSSLKGFPLTSYDYLLLNKRLINLCF